MSIFMLTLRRRELIAERTMAFHFAMREMLAAAGVEDDDIRSEEFAGY